MDPTAVAAWVGLTLGVIAVGEKVVAWVRFWRRPKCYSCGQRTIGKAYPLDEPGGDPIKVCSTCGFQY